MIKELILSILIFTIVFLVLTLSKYIFLAEIYYLKNVLSTLIITIFIMCTFEEIKPSILDIGLFIF